MTRDDEDKNSLRASMSLLKHERLLPAEAELLTKSFHQLKQQLQPLKSIHLGVSEPALMFDPMKYWGANEPA